MLYENNTLPLKMGEEISVFGRIQNHYCKSGTGSGIHCDFLLLFVIFLIWHYAIFYFDNIHFKVAYPA